MVQLAPHLIHPDDREPRRRGCSVWSVGWRRDRRGAISIEFALVLPILLAISFATFEVGRYVLLQTKFEQLVDATADLGSRDQTISPALIDDIIAAGQIIMRPFDIAARGSVTLTGVRQSPAGEPVVAWQQSSDGAATLAAGSPITLPDGLSVADGLMLVVAEVSYDYDSWLLGTIPDRMLTRRSFFRPRLGQIELVEP